ncbi:MAG: dihydrodipicolinate synthase family protein [Propionicimonas sp.]
MSLSGIIVPLVSPVADDGGVDFDAVVANAGRVLAEGVHGLYLCGGTGDASELAPSDRRRIVVDTLPVVRAAGGSAIVHVGQAPLRDVLALAEQAMAAGADAVASVPLRGPWDQTERYYAELARVAGRVVVYHMPPAGFQAGYDELARVLDLDGVIGAKVSDWNLFLLRRLIDGFPGKLFYSGLDENLGLGLLSGAHGSIGTWANLVPRFYRRVWDAAQAGETDEVLRLQRQWQRFLGLGWEGDIIAAFEALMAARGYAAACFRVPPPAPAIDAGRLSALLRLLEAVEAPGGE